MNLDKMDTLYLFNIWWTNVTDLHPFVIVMQLHPTAFMQQRQTHKRLCHPHTRLNAYGQETITTYLLMDQTYKGSYGNTYIVSLTDIL